MSFLNTETIYIYLCITNMLFCYPGFSKLRQLPNLKVLDLQYNPIHPKVLLSSLCWISSLEVLKLGVDVDTSFSIPMTYNTSKFYINIVFDICIYCMSTFGQLYIYLLNIVIIFG